MTSIPLPGPRKLRTGHRSGYLRSWPLPCPVCAVSCKEWNTSGHSAPLTDFNVLTRIILMGSGWIACTRMKRARDRTAGPCISRSCLHCEQPACVTVCPTGASYKRAEDGIVLVNADICIGCKLCSWACPYGAREFDEDQGVMRKCTLCIDRIYNENMPEQERVPACVAACPTKARHFGDLGDPDSAVSQLVAERGGFDLMPEMGYQPTNKYLPPRRRSAPVGPVEEPRATSGTGATVLRWIDRMLSR